MHTHGLPQHEQRSTAGPHTDLPRASAASEFIAPVVVVVVGVYVILLGNPRIRLSHHHLSSAAPCHANCCRQARNPQPRTQRKQPGHQTGPVGSTKYNGPVRMRNKTMGSTAQPAAACRLYSSWIHASCSLVTTAQRHGHLALPCSCHQRHGLIGAGSPPSVCAGA